MTTDPGTIVFYRATTLERVSSVVVGALPDMVTFTPDGRTLLVANEGEPNDAYTVDPEGSVSIVDIHNINAGVTIGRLGSKTFAFIGLERVGGIMVYDVTSPTSPSFVAYENSRIGGSGDLAPEGIVFVPANRSPNKHPLLIVGFEASGTVGVFEIVLQ